MDCSDCYFTASKLRKVSSMTPNRRVHNGDISQLRCLNSNVLLYRGGFKKAGTRTICRGYSKLEGSI